MMWLIVKEIKKRKKFFCSFYKVHAANPTRIESRDQTNSRDQGSSFATILGSGIKIYGLNVGSFGKKNIPYYNPDICYLQGLFYEGTYP